jgi:hypothetical protein
MTPSLLSAELARARQADLRRQADRARLVGDTRAANRRSSRTRGGRSRQDRPERIAVGCTVAG